MQPALLLAGAGVILLWGVGHRIPTRSVVAGFDALSPDRTRIVTMEWIAEGLTLCSLGILVALGTAVCGPGHSATHLVARTCAAMLLALAVLSALTGARTSVLPMKVCPFVKSAAAALYVAGTPARGREAIGPGRDGPTPGGRLPEPDRLPLRALPSVRPLPIRVDWIAFDRAPPSTTGGGIPA